MTNTQHLGWAEQKQHYLEKVEERKKGKANKDWNATESYDPLQHSVINNFRHLLRALLCARPIWRLLICVLLLMLLLGRNLTWIWSGGYCTTLADLANKTEIVVHKGLHASGKSWYAVCHWQGECSDPSFLHRLVQRIQPSMNISSWVQHSYGTHTFCC